MSPPDTTLHDRIRAAVEAEAAAAPDADGLWERARRRVARRRTERMLRVAAVVAAAVAVSTAAWQWLAPSTGTEFHGPAAPGWHDVQVGGALLSVPAGWEVLDGRGGPGPGQPCPDTATPTLWIRDDPAAGVPWHCLGETLTAVQVAPLERAVRGLPAPLTGTTTTLGAVAAWRAPVPAGLTSMEEPGGLPASTDWFAPAAHFWVRVPDGVEAGGVLDSVRPATSPDRDAVVLLVRERGTALPGEHVQYAAVDAEGRLVVWHRERVPDHVPDEGLVASSYTLADWAGLGPDRFALVEVTTPHGIRVVAGRRDGGVVAWEEPEAARHLTPGSLPQAAWSPDGTAVVWYAPREQPVMGIVQWSDPDALADGHAPSSEQVVTVADGPVQVDPAVMRWVVEAGRSAVVLDRGVPPPWDPRQEQEQRSMRWELRLEAGADSVFRLPDRPSFARAESGG